MLDREQVAVLKEIEFAFIHGHTNVCTGKEADGNSFIFGTFGYISDNCKVFFEVVKGLIVIYNVNTNNTIADIQAEINAKMEKMKGVN